MVAEVGGEVATEQVGRPLDRVVQRERLGVRAAPLVEVSRPPCRWATAPAASLVTPSKGVHWPTCQPSRLCSDNDSRSTPWPPSTARSRADVLTAAPALPSEW